MPLLDHFRPPIFPRSWESFHGSWAVSIRNDLNRRLPQRFVAETQVHLGARVEADVAEFDTHALGNGVLANGHPQKADGTGDTAVAQATIAPPQVTLSVPTNLIDQFAVEIRDRDRDFRLAGVVELISPRNKDRADAREMFIGKAAGYLLTGVGLIVADVVTNRSANLHNDLLTLHGAAPNQLLSGPPAIYAAAYAPTPTLDHIRFEIWATPLTVGDPLPTMPLKVLGLGYVLIDLEATYREVCEWSRLP